MPRIAFVCVYNQCELSIQSYPSSSSRVFCIETMTQLWVKPCNNPPLVKKQLWSLVTTNLLAVNEGGLGVVLVHLIHNENIFGLSYSFSWHFSSRTWFFQLSNYPVHMHSFIKRVINVIFLVSLLPPTILCGG